MIRTYKISGMTCVGCKTSIERNLNEVDQVITVEVDLEKEEAIINMSRLIEEEVLQKKLSSKYSISIKEDNTFFDYNKHSRFEIEDEKTKLQQLKPLLLILLYITVTSILLHYKNWSWNQAMLDFMGIFYIVFSFFKMLDLKRFPESFKMYDPLAKIIPIYGWVYPFIEISLGLMLLMRFQIDIALIVTLIVLGITTIGVTKTLLDKKLIRCACLGTALKLPMTEATFVENIIMMLMAIIMLID
jgi:copper chaperone CopZ